jgi:hypothetical protein
LLELWISNYYLKERCFDNNDVHPVSVSHKHTFAPDERDQHLDAHFVARVQSYGFIESER